ncbi:hypothetical protein ABZZ36_15190 [Actinacidiphila glaucinigra]|uniref:Uncharacterized protein n=1 Tax=Actinacidiphila glaucinigra TaxID=235986 RepID=A0A239F7D2_9ACTN|nr:hypothetical protein [Actinacidiphila glaucinigra]SNS52735.1 hypothetical protein SAMN05216252_106353 [Actinacidiphila glaucinigra]
MSTTDIPTGESGPRYVRLQVELVLEITGSGELTDAALDQIGGDEYMPDDERQHAEASVRQDESEALAYLVDPFDLVTSVPGIELVQASWSCAHTEYDPDSDEWDLYDDEADDEADEEADEEADIDEEEPRGR